MVSLTAIARYLEIGGTQGRDRRRQPYAIASIIGAAFGLIIVLSAVAVSAHGLQAFFSLGGLIIVVGGVISSAFMSYESVDVRCALNAIPKVLRRPHVSHHDLKLVMDAIVAWAHLTHEHCTRELELEVRKSPMQDPFMRYGLNMVVGDHAPDDVRIMMKTAADATYDRDYVPVDVLHTMASHAPAFGMVGTLVGMVGMLYGLSDNVGSIGSTLAIAFLSTLYGVLSARMIYMPAASRLQQDVDRVELRNHLITEGMVLLAAKKSPMYIRDRLSGFLPAGSRDFYDVLASSVTHEDVRTANAAGPARDHPRLRLTVVNL
jgi:chemotaxis protein MotA